MLRYLLCLRLLLLLHYGTRVMLAELDEGMALIATPPTAETGAVSLPVPAPDNLKTASLEKGLHSLLLCNILV